MIGGVGLTKGLGGYIFGSGPDPVLYNCSNKTTAEWLETGEKNLNIGLYFLVTGVIFETVQAVALTTMHLSGLTANPCYRIMFVLGLYEMFCIFNGSIFPGLNYLRGDVYCSIGDGAFVVGSLTVGVYCGCCWCILLLAFNRLAVMVNIKSLVRLFDHKSSLDILLSLSVVYSLFVTLFTTPIPFNTKMRMHLFDPMIYDSSLGYDYSNQIHSFNNLGTSVVILTVYGALSCFSIFATREFPTDSARIFQRQVFIQSAVICLFNATSEVLYVVIQIPALNSYLSDSIPVLAQAFWQWGMATSAILNCTINKTIRTTICKFFKTGSLNKVYAQSITNTRTPNAFEAL